MPQIKDLINRLLRRRDVRLAKSCDQSHRRKQYLSLEELEDRQLLSAASLLGSVFNDLSLGIANVEVHLTPHAGSGQTNVASGTSLTTTTNAEGSYRFDRLAAGQYDVFLPDNANNRSLLKGLIPNSSEQIQTFVVTPQHVAGYGETSIDSFQTFQTATDAVSMLGPQPTVASSSTSAPEAVGGERDLFVAWTPGGTGGEVALRVNAFGGQLLQFDTTAGAQGIRQVVWDGFDADPFSLDPTGLGGLDVTDGGQNHGLRLRIWADHSGGRAEIGVYSGTDNFSTAIVTIPETRTGTGSDVEAVDILFEQLANTNQPAFTSQSGEGADFSQVGAIQLAIIDDPTALSVDGQVDLFGTLLSPQRLNFEHLAQSPGIHLELHTNDIDADDAFGTEVPQLLPGESVTWDYFVTNTGNLPLANVVVRDDHGTPHDSSDDFSSNFINGDSNDNGLLDLDEEWIFRHTSTALNLITGNVGTVPGGDVIAPQPTYENIGVVTATTNDHTVMATDPSHYSHALFSGLGDLAWLDTNENGLQDPGEVGVNGITVTLDSAGLDGIWGTMDDLRAQTFSGATGNLGEYFFSNLIPGAYQVSFSGLPESYAFTTRDPSRSATIDSDVDPSRGVTDIILLGPGEINRSIDVGLIEQRAALGDFVWFDSNNNGLQDVGEPGINGISVTVLAGDGTPVGTQVTTTHPIHGEPGYYRFDDLAAGDYHVVFSYQIGPHPPGQPWEFTTAHVGGSEMEDQDSNAVVNANDPTTAKSQPVTLFAGEYNPTVDAGLFSALLPLGSAIGDLVWEDLNRDGIQDTAEPGIAGVSVELLDAGGIVLETTTTDATGNYGFFLFTPAVPGTFQIRLANIPTGYFLTSADQGTNDLLDSDVDPESGTTSLFTLTDNTTTLTFDAGLVRRLTKFDFLTTSFP